MTWLRSGIRTREKKCSPYRTSRRSVCRSRSSGADGGTFATCRDRRNVGNVPPIRSQQGGEPADGFQPLAQPIHSHAHGDGREAEILGDLLGSVPLQAELKDAAVGVVQVIADVPQLVVELG